MTVDSLELLRSYECPDGCEFFDSDDGTPFVTEREAFEMLGGDEHGFVRCIDCGAELEPTVRRGAMRTLDLILDVEHDKNQRLLNAVMRPWPCSDVTVRLYRWAELHAGEDPDSEFVSTDRTRWPLRCKAAYWLADRFNDFDLAWVQRRRFVGRDDKVRR